MRMFDTEYTPPAFRDYAYMRLRLRKLQGNVFDQRYLADCEDYDRYLLDDRLRLLGHSPLPVLSLQSTTFDGRDMHVTNLDEGTVRTPWTDRLGYMVPQAEQFIIHQSGHWCHIDQSGTVAGKIMKTLVERIWGTSATV